MATNGLPPGFELDAPSARAGGLPPGFEMDQPAPAHPRDFATPQEALAAQQRGELGRDSQFSIAGKPVIPGTSMEWAAHPPAPTREVGAVESALRTAGTAAQRTVGMFDLAAVGMARMFGNQRDVDETLGIFEQRQRRMAETYAPKEGERFSTAGSLVGGVASAPVEVVGGFGVQHGVERAREVLERGGTGGQAATAGATTGAVRAALNLLPAKAGGRVASMLESRIGSIAGGALTGGAIAGVGGVAGRAAENVALPEGEQFAELRQPVAPTAAEVGLGAAFGAAPGIGSSAVRAAQEATRQAKAVKARLEVPERQAVENALAAGFKLPPAAAKGGRTARVVQTAAGSSRLSKEMSAHNSDVAAKLVREDLGLPEDVPLTREATDSIRREAGQDYAAVQQVGKFSNDAQYVKDLDAVSGPLLEAAKDYPDLAGNPIIKRVQALRDVKAARTGSAIEVVKDLREEASVAYRAGRKNLGNAFRDVAQAVDNSMDRALGRMAEKGAPDLADAVGKYREARVRIAKAYLADDAMTGKPGEINLNVYGRVHKKNPKLLTGGARQVGEFAAAFGDEGLTQPKGKTGGIGSTSFDLLMGALHLPVSGPAAVAAAVARPVARAVLASETMQRRLRQRNLRELERLAPEEAPPPPEPTLERGFEPTSGRPQEPGPLGDLTPEWETAPGAAPQGAPLEVVPTEGLVPALGEQPPTTGSRRAPLQMEPVPGRPDLPDVMVAGGPAEVAATEAAGRAMQTPEAALARQQQRPAAPPAADPRLAKIDQALETADSDAVREVLQTRRKAVEKTIQQEEVNLKRANDLEALEQAAKETDDLELKAAFQKKADALREEKIPVGEATELETTPTPAVRAPKIIPAGKATEVIESAPTGRAPDMEPLPTGEAREVTRSGVEVEQKLPVGETRELLRDMTAFPEISEAFMAAQEPVKPISERGIKQVRQALEAGRADGSLDKDGVDLALWMLDKNPNLASRLKVRVVGGDGGRARGDYEAAIETIRLFKDSERNPLTATHEILHHTERMMPTAVRRGIQKEWGRALQLATQKARGAERELLLEIPKALRGDKDAQRALEQGFSRGVLTRDKHYQLTNPSEFWAVNGPRILNERFTGRGSWRAQAKQWVKEMIERVKGIVGLRSDAPILKAFDELLDPQRTSGEQQSSKMLSRKE